MSKIENWSRTRTRRKDVLAWEHDEKDAEVVVFKPEADSYGVVFSANNRKTPQNLYRGISSKEEARKKAVKWMEKHPNAKRF